jgi:hypothetical protein
LRYDADVGEKFMFKKLLIFSLAFCLGLISLQLLKLNSETVSQKTTADINVSDTSQIVQTIQPKSVATLAGDCYRDFKAAVAENEKVASLIYFPIEVQFINKKSKPYYNVIKNEKEFLLNYDRIFDDSFKKFIVQGKANLGFSTSGEIFIYRSEIRLKPFYKNDGRDAEVKVIKINKYPTYPNIHDTN